ncbi:RelA-associated inhibitor [Pteropus alecto]|uniref:RelA-associated inhibitor n=1 Tax=Pteropus alecto TaxID=9402 RepID=L5KP95_PTEAL|nr:RelA-associated inhibitor [Pteropus alecto]
MDSEAFQSTRDVLDLNFQSLAMKHMDLKQMELDTAAAKVDELTKQLESLWSDSPTPPGSQAGAPPRLSRYSSSPVPEPFGSRGSSRKTTSDGADSPFGRSESAPALLPYSSLSPKGRPPLAEGPQVFFPERGPSPRSPATYDTPPAFGSPLLGVGGSAFAPPLRAQDDLMLRRRPPKAWNESDLDVAYEKKSSQTASYERLDVFARPSSPGLQLLPWRESSLDGLGAAGKENLTSATLPRNYKVSPLANDRRSDVGSYRRSLGSPQPQPQPQPPAPAPQLPQQTWAPASEGPPKLPAELEPEPELEVLLAPVLEAGDADEGAVTRPLSPTRLQPALPPEAQSLPELEEVARVLAEIPRPLKRRGSMEQSPAVALPPTHKKQYQQIISRLFHRHGGPAGPEPELTPITEGSEARAGPPAPAPPAPIPPPAPPQSSPPDQLQNVEMRSVLRKAGSPRKARRARLNPLVLLLDAALTGELDVCSWPRWIRGSQSPPFLVSDVEQSMGLMHNGVVYALWDYSAEFGDELSFREGESVTVLRRDGPEETDWWWATLHGQEGYVPRNYFGLFPRVKSQRNKV